MLFATRRFDAEATQGEKLGQGAANNEGSRCATLIPSDKLRKYC